ncbi:MAG: hypothetical protein ACOYX1_00670, partial [Acidobacteriota bacterium]
MPDERDVSASGAAGFISGLAAGGEAWLSGRSGRHTHAEAPAASSLQPDRGADVSSGWGFELTGLVDLVGFEPTTSSMP